MTFQNCIFCGKQKDKLRIMFMLLFSIPWKHRKHNMSKKQNPSNLTVVYYELCTVFLTLNLTQIYVWFSENNISILPWSSRKYIVWPLKTSNRAQVVRATSTILPWCLHSASCTFWTLKAPFTLMEQSSRKWWRDAFELF